MKLQAVFFDMGGTIESFRYDTALRVKNAGLLRNCLERGGICLEQTDEQLAGVVTRGITAYHRWNMDSQIELPPVKVWQQFVLKDFALSELALTPVAEELAFIYETRFYERQMNPEIPAVLAQIQAMGLKIGCISNVQSRGQVRANLKEYGIIDYFSTIVCSSEYGRRKPDPAIFYYATRLASVPTSACAYVGDKIDRDISGAQSAGFRLAVQIHHRYDDGERSRVEATPDATIQDMRELIPLLEREMEKDCQAILNSLPRKVQAILMDAGDILYTRPQKGEHFSAFLNQHVLCPAADFEDQKSKLQNQAFVGQIDRQQYYAGVVRLNGITDPAAVEAGVAALEADDLMVDIMPEVPETLLTLKQQGFLLGIVTDTALPVSVKLKWFEQAGFGSVWDTFISSQELGVRKPDPRIFMAALDQLGLCASQVVFVGHKKTELDGAKAMGITTIAFNKDHDSTADLYLNHFSELIRLPLLAQPAEP